MSLVIVTGSAGLVGSETARHFAGQGWRVLGIDNDQRQLFFGPEASTVPIRRRLERELGAAYRHFDVDVRDRERIEAIFRDHSTEISAVVHAAAQPSHDWAAREPLTDFSINATGTLHLLEATRRHAPEVPFLFTSTNKVYGDTPNRLPLQEQPQRWEIQPDHTYADGIREDMPVDGCLHSLFGVSKLAADVLVQEYGRYFGLRTACFRGGCLTGPSHRGTELHGFLAYLMKCTATGAPYRVYGYLGKQVRDNIHSADLVRAFYEVVQAPRQAEVYNIGGGRTSNCSMLEAIDLCQDIAGRELSWTYVEDHRIGDHRWWIGDNRRFQSHYPGWTLQHDVPMILEEIYHQNRREWQREGA